jgi:hypothetical protein
VVAVVGGCSGEIGVAGRIGARQRKIAVACAIGKAIEKPEENLPFTYAASVAGSVAEKLQMIKGVRAATVRACKGCVPTARARAREDRADLAIIGCAHESDSQAAVGKNGVRGHRVATARGNVHAIELVGRDDISLQSENVSAAHQHAVLSVSCDDVPGRRSDHAGCSADQTVE